MNAAMKNNIFKHLYYKVKWHNSKHKHTCANMNSFMLFKSALQSCEKILYY